MTEAKYLSMSFTITFFLFGITLLDTILCSKVMFSLFIDQKLILLCTKKKGYFSISQKFFQYLVKATVKITKVPETRF